MHKLKEIRKIIATLFFVFLMFFIVKPILVTAASSYFIPLTTLNTQDEFSGKNWDILPIPNNQDWYQGLKGVQCSCTAGFADLGTNGGVVDFCSKVDIQSFCNSIPTCGGDVACIKSLGSVYDGKIADAKKTIIDNLTSSNGLDSQKVSDATASCNGDLACISKVITALSSDSSVAQSTQTTVSTSGPLTLSDAQNLISSQSSSSTINNAASTVGSTGESLLNKQPAPRVDVNFTSNGTITDGAKISALAVPSMFKTSDTSSLYFTWYIKHNNKNAGLQCDLADSLNDDNKNCDLDNDGKVTVNDWKIAAARIIVQGNFDKTTADYSKTVDESLSGEKANPSIKQWSVNTRDDNGDIITTNDDKNDPPSCYVQDPKSGVIYEMQDSTASFEDTPCPTGYVPACANDVKATCDVLNPTSTNNLFSACQVSSDQTGDSSSAAENIYYCSSDDANFKAAPKCNDGGDPICIKAGDNSFPDSAQNPNDPSNPLLGVILAKSDSTTSNNAVCGYLAKPNNADTTGTAPFLDNTNVFKNANGTLLEDCSTVTNEMVNGIKDSNGNVLAAGNAKLAPTCKFEKKSDGNTCKHLFPYFPGSKQDSENIPVTIYDQNKKQFVNTTVNMSNSITGDGDFTLAEKEFWGANPSVKSTNGNSQTDEANVMGLGIDKFDWTYMNGDEVGVAVEGESSLMSDHTDSSNRIMWAFSKNSCDAINDAQNKSGENRAYYVENSTGIHTINFDLDKCLPENLLTPNLGDAQQFVEPSVALNATPNNPVNDPNGRGDTLQVAAATANMTNVFYEWHVLLSLDGSDEPKDTTNWIDITNDLIANKSFSNDDQQGLDKSDLSVLLNIPDSLLQSKIANFSDANFYLKIKANVTENNGINNQSQVGETVVKINKQQNQILIYPVSATIDGDLKLVKSINNVSTELSNAECDNSACYVTKNQVVGVQIPDASGTKLSGFSWKINGNSFTCTSSISTSDCSTPAGNVLFFPVLGNVGEAVDVVADARNATTGATVEVSKHFVIVEPSAQITTNDQTTAWPKILGYYRDSSGQPSIPDYSTQVMETRNGNNITLQGKFYPASAAGQMGYVWTVDGQTVETDPNNPGVLSFGIDKTAGDSYNVGLTATRTSDAQNQAIYMRNALLKDWGVAMDDTTELNNAANIQINVLDSVTVAQNLQKTSFAASLITHLPEQFMFLLKITLTAFALLFSTGILFAFIPEPIFQDSEIRRY